MLQVSGVEAVEVVAVAEVLGDQAQTACLLEDTEACCHKRTFNSCRSVRSSVYYDRECVY